MNGLLAILVLAAAMPTTEAAPQEENECAERSSTSIHADARVGREILADVNGDGDRELVTGYVRSATEEAYVHVRFGSGWATRVRLDHLDDLFTDPHPEGVVTLADQPTIVVNAGTGLVVVYLFVTFQDCRLVPITLAGSDQFPDIWTGGGLNHSEWFTCREEGVAQVEAYRPEPDSDLYAAEVTLYALESGEFAPSGSVQLEFPLTLDQVTEEFPVCSLHGTFIDDGMMFEEEIEWLAARRFARGCNPPVNDRYCPQDPVTRGQMAAMLARALGLAESGSGDHFTDDNDSIFQTDIDELAAAGITRGCNPPQNNEYCPHDAVTRGEMAAMLTRALELTDTGTGDHFTDDNDSIFQTDIDKLAATGITRGCNPPRNSRYCPDDHVTRGQMAAFLQRALG